MPWDVVRGHGKAFFLRFYISWTLTKNLQLSKSKSKEMLLIGGRGDLFEQLLFLASFNSSHFAIRQNSDNQKVR